MHAMKGKLENLNFKSNSRDQIYLIPKFWSQREASR